MTALVACSRCKEPLPSSEFYACKKMASGLQSACKQCQITARKRWSRDAKDRHNKTTIQRRRTRGEEYLLVQKKWRTENKAHLNAYMRRWRIGKRLLRAHHQMRLLSVRPAWANKFFIREIYDLARRRTDATGMIWEVDHIVPLTNALVCGLHVENNLRVIPMTANRSKGNRYWPQMPTEVNCV